MVEVCYAGKDTLDVFTPWFGRPSLPLNFAPHSEYRSLVIFTSPIDSYQSLPIFLVPVPLAGPPTPQFIPRLIT